jgi:hypothetical protein
MKLHLLVLFLFVPPSDPFAPSAAVSILASSFTPSSRRGNTGHLHRQFAFTPSNDSSSSTSVSGQQQQQQVPDYTAPLVASRSAPHLPDLYYGLPPYYHGSPGRSLSASELGPVHPPPPGAHGYPDYISRLPTTPTTTTSNAWGHGSSSESDGDGEGGGGDGTETPGGGGARYGLRFAPGRLRRRKQSSCSSVVSPPLPLLPPAPPLSPTTTATTGRPSRPRRSRRHVLLLRFLLSLSIVPAFIGVVHCLVNAPLLSFLRDDDDDGDYSPRKRPISEPQRIEWLVAALWVRCFSFP